MGFLDRLFGRGQQQGYQQAYPQQGYPQQGYQQGYPQQGYPQDARSPQSAANDQAIRRYQYLLQTAPPEQIEKAHEQAFAQLTPEQRREVLARLAQSDPNERPRDDSPQGLARAATRYEMRHPGGLYHVFGPTMMGGGMMGGGMMGGRMGGGMFGGGGMGMGGLLLTSIAGSFIGTAIADEFFDHDGFMDWDTSHPGEAAFGDTGDFAADNAGFDGGGNFNDDASLDASRVDDGSAFTDQGFDQGYGDTSALGDTGFDIGFDGGGLDGGFDGGGFDGGFDSF